MTEESASLEQPAASPVPLLLGAHFVGLMLAYHFGRDGRSDLTMLANTSLVNAQLNLVALWVAFGRAPAMHRWGAFACLTGAWVYVDHALDGDRVGELSYFLRQGGMTALLAQGARLVGLRVIHCNDPAPSDPTQIRWGLAQVFALTTSAALVAAGQALRSHPFTVASVWNEFVFNTGPVAAIGVASAWAVLGEGRWQRRVLLLIGCAFLVGIAQLPVVEWQYLGTVGLEWQMYAYRGAGYALTSVILCASLGIFRMLGYRLVGFDDAPTPEAVA